MKRALVTIVTCARVYCYEPPKAVAAPLEQPSVAASVTAVTTSGAGSGATYGAVGLSVGAVDAPASGAVGKIRELPITKKS